MPGDVRAEYIGVGMSYVGYKIQKGSTMKEVLKIA